MATAQLNSQLQKLVKAIETLRVELGKIGKKLRVLEAANDHSESVADDTETGNTDPGANAGQPKLKDSDPGANAGQPKLKDSDPGANAGQPKLKDSAPSLNTGHSTLEVNPTMGHEDVQPSTNMGHLENKDGLNTNHSKTVESGGHQLLPGNSDHGSATPTHPAANEEGSPPTSASTQPPS